MNGSSTPTVVTMPGVQKDARKEIEAFYALRAYIRKMQNDAGRRKDEIRAKFVDDLKSGQASDPAAMAANMLRRWKEAQARLKDVDDQRQAFDEIASMVDARLEELRTNSPNSSLITSGNNGKK